MAGKKGLHMVHGEWMTIAEAARRLGVKYQTLTKWRCLHRTTDGRPGLLVDAWDFYDARRRGLNPQKPRGKKPKKHRYRGKRLTIRQIAEKMGVSTQAIYKNMERKGCSVQEAIDCMDARRTRRAERELMKILTGE